VSRTPFCAALALVLTGSSACSIEIARFELAAIEPAAGAEWSFGLRAGRSCRWQVLGVPFGLPTFEEAMPEPWSRSAGGSCVTWS
jgi:hypothetical protein